MSEGQKNTNIPLLNPLVFKEELIDKDWHPLNRLQVNDFFIHSFKDDAVPLKLPLPLHKKTVNDFALLTNGRMTKTIGLESFSLRANQFLFTPKNSITTTRNISKDLEGYYCHFSDDFIGNHPFLKQWNTQPVLQNRVLLKEEEMAVVLPLLRRITTLYRQIKEPLNYELIRYYLSAFIAEVSIISEKKSLPDTTHPLVSSFGQLVNEKFKESKSVKYYAGLLNVSPNHLNKVVKTGTGKTASDIIDNICILEAKVLLNQTHMNISEVAYELGFEDTSYFSRFFKKHAQSSPAEYRKMIEKYK